MNLYYFARYFNHEPRHERQYTGLLSYKGIWALILSLTPVMVAVGFLSDAHKAEFNYLLVKLIAPAVPITCMLVIFNDLLQARRSRRYANSVDIDRANVGKKLHDMERLLLSSVKQIEVVGAGEPPLELADIYDAILTQSKSLTDVDETEPEDEAE